jgi:hypothetical protein
VRDGEHGEHFWRRRTEEEVGRGGAKREGMGESSPTSLDLMAYLMVVFRGRSRQPRPAGLTLRVPQCYGLAPDPRAPVRLRWSNAEK